MVLMISIKSMWEGGYPAPHLGFYRIKSYLEAQNIYAVVVDIELEALDLYLELIEKGVYKIVAFSVSNYEMELDLELLWKCRKASSAAPGKCLFVGGGQQATHNYEQWLNCGLDVAVLGYGERPMLALCERLSVYPDGSVDEICLGVQGTAYLDQNQNLIVQSQVPLTREEFEFLTYERMLKSDIPYESYWKYNEEKIRSIRFNNIDFKIRNIRMYTTSHCPGRCAFCSSQYFLDAAQKKTTPILMLSADQIQDLLLFNYKKYKPTSFFFGSDNFIITSRKGRRRVKELCKRIINLKKNGDLPENMAFHCMARVNSFFSTCEDGQRYVDHTLLKLMKEAGFENISVGVETFCDRLLTCPSINKSGISSADNIKVLDNILDAGLIPQILLILAIPDSTVDEMFLTMKTAAEFILKGAQVAATNRLYADPGAPVTNMERYTISHRERKNHATGEVVLINHQVIPFDAKIKKVSDHFDAVVDAEVALLRKKTPWKDGILPKFFVSLASFIGISKFLGDSEMTNYLIDIFQQATAKQITSMNLDN